MMESWDMNPYIFGQLIFDKCNSVGERVVFFNNWSWDNWVAIGKNDEFSSLLDKLPRN